MAKHYKFITIHNSEIIELIGSSLSAILSVLRKVANMCFILKNMIISAVLNSLQESPMLSLG